MWADVTPTESLRGKWTVEGSSTIDPFLIIVPAMQIDEKGHTVRKLHFPEFVRLEVTGKQLQPVLRVVSSEFADARRTVTVSNDWIKSPDVSAPDTATLTVATECSAPG